MKKLVFSILAIFILAAPAIAGDNNKPDTTTYFQHTPSQTLPPFSLFNPAITEHKDGKVTKSFFQHKPSQTFPAGSLFNPLITTTEKEPNK
jgi:hypothetical protein